MSDVFCSFGKASIIPEAIKNALEAGEFSLLIKGDAGTGKTTLAFEIANIISNTSDVFFITSRVSPKALQSHFKWLSAKRMKQMIVDARTTRVSGIVKGFEKISSTDLTNLLKFIYDKIKKSPKKPVTIILDSIDALKNSLGFDWDDYKVEQTFIDLVEREGGNIIFIVERYDKIKFDFLVDGVIHLEKDYKDGRVLRYMSILKLRGYEIKYPSRLFTLRNGRFMSFEPLLAKNPHVRFYSSTREMNEAKETLYTKFPELDRLLGGFPKGSFNVIEVSEDLGDTSRCFFWGLLQNALMSNYFLYFLLPSGMSPKTTYKVLKCLSGESPDLLKRIVIFYPTFDKEIEIKQDGAIVPIPTTNMRKTFEKTEEIILSRKSNIKATKTFGLVGTDILEQVYGFDALKSILPRWVTNTKRLGRWLFATVRSNQQIKTHIKAPATTYLKMEKHFGIPTLYGVFPYTPFFVITALKINKKGEMLIDIIPIE